MRLIASMWIWPVSITASHTADDLFDLITALTDLDVELIGNAGHERK